ncbi:MAG: hypothetical protein GX593_08115 [Actinomycetales bacterium]|nr:hypothetical protein [Actinomycetales bacterium]
MVPKWLWAFDDAAGNELVEPVSPVFTTQFDAESWLGEHWRAASVHGARRARLLHDGEPATAPVLLPEA